VNLLASFGTPFFWFTQFRGTPIPVGDGLLAMAASWLEYFIGGVHIHFCGNGLLWFRFYSGLPGKAPSNQTLLPTAQNLRSASRGACTATAPRGELTLDLVVWWCTRSPVGAAEGCDLLILLLRSGNGLPAKA